MSSETKVYVGNLAHATTKESLEDHFAQYGEIAECVVMTEKDSGRSRGFGFVTFTTSTAMEAAVRASHEIDGRTVNCKRAMRETRHGGGGGGGGKHDDGRGMYNVVKIFVGGLPATCDLEKLKEHFGQFGEIQDAVVMMDAQTQRHRGFGFVTFKESKGVEAALSNDKTNKIDNKWVEVKRCMPQEVMRDRERGRQDDGPDDDRRDGPPHYPPHGHPPPGYYPPPGAYGGGYPGYPPPGYGGYPGYGYYPPPPPDYYAAYGYPPPQGYGYGGYPPMPIPPSLDDRASRSRSRGRRRRRA